MKIKYRLPTTHIKPSYKYFNKDLLDIEGMRSYLVNNTKYKSIKEAASYQVAVTYFSLMIQEMEFEIELELGHILCFYSNDIDKIYDFWAISQPRNKHIIPCAECSTLANRAYTTKVVDKIKTKNGAWFSVASPTKHQVVLQVVDEEKFFIVDERELNKLVLEPLKSKILRDPNVT